MTFLIYKKVLFLFVKSNLNCLQILPPRLPTSHEFDHLSTNHHQDPKKMLGQLRDRIQNAQHDLSAR